MSPARLNELTKAFALASVGANYRAACRARSRRDFIAKMGIVEEEADESEYWLELAVEAGLLKPERVAQLRDDARHIVAKTVLSIRRARGTPSAAPHAARRTHHAPQAIGNPECS